MRDPFHLPRRFLRNAMVDRRFPTRQGPLRIWTGFLRPDDSSPGHHDVLEDAYSAMWFLRGEVIYSDAIIGVKHAVPGDLVCRLPRRRHSTQPVDGSGVVECFIHLEASWFRRLADLGAVPDQAHARLGWDPGLADRCLSFLERLPRFPASDWPLALAEAQALLAAFAIGCAREGPADELMDEACTLLAADLPGRLGLDGIAHRLGVGVESFRKRFAAATGQSPGAWRIARRIDAACAQLLAGDQPLATVAASLGYADVPTFAKQFRRVTGLPPAAWRQARRNGTPASTRGSSAW